VVTRLGTVPALLCIVAAALLGGWGWGAREDSADRAREEDAQRPPEEGDSLFSGPDAPDQRELSCGVLVDAAMLQTPADPFALFGPTGPDAGPATTLATSGVDTAWTLVGLLQEDLVVGIPDLDHPDLVAAILGLRSTLQAALTRTAEPLSDPEVVAAAATLRTALVDRCL
jgi:hypothetical protein